MDVYEDMREELDDKLATITKQLNAEGLKASHISGGSRRSKRYDSESRKSKDIDSGFMFAAQSAAPK